MIPGGRLLRSVTSVSDSAVHSLFPPQGGVASPVRQALPVKFSLPGVVFSASGQMALPDVNDGAAVLPSVSASADKEATASVEVDASWSASLDLALRCLPEAVVSPPLLSTGNDASVRFRSDGPWVVARVGRFFQHAQR
jgi:hypothetical protein